MLFFRFFQEKCQKSTKMLFFHDIKHIFTKESLYCIKGEFLILIKNSTSTIYVSYEQCFYC